MSDRRSLTKGWFPLVRRKTAMIELTETMKENRTREADIASRAAYEKRRYDDDRRQWADILDRLSFYRDENGIPVMAQQLRASYDGQHHNIPPDSIKVEMVPATDTTIFYCRMTDYLLNRLASRLTPNDIRFVSGIIGERLADEIATKIVAGEMTFRR